MPTTANYAERAMLQKQRGVKWFTAPDHNLRRPYY